MLWLILRVTSRSQKPKGDWKGALSLFIYALAFSYAYIGLDTGSRPIRIRSTYICCRIDGCSRYRVGLFLNGGKG